MTHLVTGAAGFIGFHIAKAFLATGEKVAVSLTSTSNRGRSRI